MKPVTGNFSGYQLTGNRFTTLMPTVYFWLFNHQQQKKMSWLNKKNKF